MDQDAHLPHDSLGPRALAIVTPFLIIAILVFSIMEVIIYSLFIDLSWVSTAKPIQCRPINSHWEEVLDARCLMEHCLITVLMALGLVAAITIILRLIKVCILDFASPESFLRAHT
ncbi:uncharacterized protein BKA55DRAFT_664704 [Fusarium redolens]|uniref:Uncharacterized protein n=1 Tax=Fusarium redolens TaxID=48865 RepID=A0A9P9K861_FUSRE|nr:uncharacterized protein BKA55DRAFT_664704 [Fusarium redolens]KAH7247515.1 hypothetical protein BKA55DRAFT_664704 [Fusarium redolens]